MAKCWYAQPLMDRIHSSVWWLYWIVSWILLCSCCQVWFMNLDSFGNVVKMGWIESESRAAKMNLGESRLMVRAGAYMSAICNNFNSPKYFLYMFLILFGLSLSSASKRVVTRTGWNKFNNPCYNDTLITWVHLYTA